MLSGAKCFYQVKYVIWVRYFTLSNMRKIYEAETFD